MTGVVICDPPSPLRSGLAERVAAVPEVAWVELVDDMAGLGGVLESSQPDVVLLSSGTAGPQLPAAVRLVRRVAPGARILLLTMGTDPDQVVAGLAAGASGYLARDAALGEAAAALALLPPRAAAEGATPSQRRRPSATGLTERELQVLQAISRGRSNSQIGEDLFLSEDTVKTHARRLFRKLRVRDRAHAVAEGFRRGLIG